MDFFVYVQLSKLALISIMIVGTIAMLMCCTAIVLLVVLYNRERQLAEETAKRQDVEHEIALQASRVQEADRVIMQITGALHDHLGNKLAFLNTLLGDFSKQLQHDQPITAQQVQFCRQFARESLADFRDFNRVIQGEQLVEAGLISAIQAEAALLRRHFSLQVSVHIKPDCRDDLEHGVALHIFRILQEVAANITKHAQARVITVSLAMYDQDTFQLTVKDDGKGFDVERLPLGESMGLSNMQFRADCVNATLRIESAPNKGTQITLYVPMFTTSN
ncbi:sensor histidine kinase [Parapedobacter tibetensis]|uniref:sensor histidine kinase n=1 Tax=Parapedobacter tibetensis TaxID=2972951 RepID=UPI00214D65E1|nr:ATP-binding protein [Parapedobacter tibetensis]